MQETSSYDDPFRSFADHGKVGLIDTTS